MSEVTLSCSCSNTQEIRIASTLVIVNAIIVSRSGHGDQSINRLIVLSVTSNQQVLAKRV